MCYNRLGVEIKGECYLHERRLEGCTFAMIYLGEIYEARGDIATAMEFYKEGHDGGNQNATVKLGRLGRTISAQTALLDNEPVAQVTMEANLHDARTSGAVTTRITEDVLMSRDDEDRRWVVLLKFERSDKLFFDALMSAEALAPCQCALEKESRPIILSPSRAKAFLHPHHYDAVMEALQQKNVVLHKDNVIVEPELADTVEAVLQRIVKTKKVHKP